MIKYYSQKDPQWANDKLGTCKDTIAQSGCKITCYAMIDGRTPQEINQLFIKNNVYVSGCLTVDEACAKALGLEYGGRVYAPPKDICIAETNHYKKYGVPQHFFIYNPATDERVDPLDLNPSWEDNDYHIVSYRLLKKSSILESPSFGIDISRWQGEIDWDKVEADFIICKCTQGTEYIDPTYKKNKEAIREKGIKFGAYHFTDGGDPIEEAGHFLENIGDINSDDIIVLDWEIEHKDPVGWSNKFLERVEEYLGFTPYWYSNDARAVKYGDQIPYPKWVARYKDYSGDLDWDYQPKADSTIWQYTSRGKVDGIDGNVDLNIAKFNKKTMDKKLMKKLSELVGRDLGGNLNDNELRDVINKIKSLQSEIDVQEALLSSQEATIKENKLLVKANEGLAQHVQENITKINSLTKKLEEQTSLAEGELKAVGIIRLLQEILKKIINF